MELPQLFYSVLALCEATILRYLQAKFHERGEICGVLRNFWIFAQQCQVREIFEICLYLKLPLNNMM